MKRLVPRAINDAQLLSDLAADQGRDLRHYLADIPRIAGQYAAYRTASGNPVALNAPTELNLNASLSTLLRGYYSSKPLGLSFIDEYRESSPDFCPMCGSATSGTIDHIFPKKEFPELSFFSWNLVPACICNSKRGNDYKGGNLGERVLHPYFDTALDQRLLQAVATVHGNDFTCPSFDIEVIVIQPIEFRSAVSFHLNNVVRRTNILSHFRKNWGKLLRRPAKTLLGGFPPGEVTVAVIEMRLQETIDFWDDHFDSLNNWESWFFSGVYANGGLKAFLAQHAEMMRLSNQQSIENP